VLADPKTLAHGVLLRTCRFSAAGGEELNLELDKAGCDYIYDENEQR
jgi:hypothetical protein